MKTALIAACIALALHPVASSAQKGKLPDSKTGNYDPTIEDSVRKSEMLHRTTALTRLGFALRESGGSGPKYRRALRQLKAIDTKVGSILDNSKLTDGEKKQRLRAVQTKGLLKLTNEFGTDLTDLTVVKSAWTKLSGDAFWTKLKGVTGSQFPEIQRRLTSADRLAESAQSFKLAGWPDI